MNEARLRRKQPRASALPRGVVQLVDLRADPEVVSDAHMSDPTDHQPRGNPKNHPPTGDQNSCDEGYQRYGHASKARKGGPSRLAYSEESHLSDSSIFHGISSANKS